MTEDGGPLGCFLVEYAPPTFPPVDLILSNFHDNTLAMQTYLTASIQKHPVAQFNLGRCLMQGIGIPRDPTRAAHHFQLAA